MEKSAGRKKILNSMFASRNFEQLAPFSDSNSWEGMSKEERELLGLLFVMQGGAAARERGQKGIRKF